MILYHGSNIGNIKVLKPNQADHDRPYVYMTTMDVVAAFYLCNAVERPWYGFPYGVETGSDIPVYHELYPNALREVSEGVSGYIYKVLAEETVRQQKARAESKYDVAIQYFDRAGAIGIPFYDELYCKSMLYEKTGKYREACKLYQEIAGKLRKDGFDVEADMAEESEKRLDMKKN